MDNGIGIILIRGAVETLEFFSEEMAKTFRREGLFVFFWDMKRPKDSRAGLEEFRKRKRPVLLTFNFIGLSGEEMFEEGDRTLWQRLGAQVHCIMVDHPIYYRKQLRYGDPAWHLYCVDRDHANFVRRWYPDYASADFLPLAGTRLGDGEPADFPTRPIDVLFAGNYVRLDMLQTQIAGLDRDNRVFLEDCIDRLLSQPLLTIEQVAEEALLRELPGLPREELLDAMYHFVVVDLYVRSWYRRRLVCSLAEQDIPVHVIGKDWEHAGCGKPENLIRLDQQDSMYCLRAMQKSKISLNIIPWFKNGAHDRIFNGMLQGCVTVTDSSSYLEPLLADGKNSMLFSLDDLRSKNKMNLSEKIKSILADPKRAQTIAGEGCHAAAADHTWEKRALEIIQNLNI